MAMAKVAKTLGEAYPSHFVLGVGVRNAPSVSGAVETGQMALAGQLPTSSTYTRSIHIYDRSRCPEDQRHDPPIRPCTS
jgi:hypothetical protein